MDRRELLRKLMLGIPAGVFLPSLLSSCKDDLVPGDINFSGKVLIIGAGAAGIYAAALLEEYGIDYQIVEASNRTGGRINSNLTFSDVPIELGAEEIHGQRSILYDLANHFATSRLGKDDLTDYFLFNNQLRTESYLRESAELAGEGETLYQLIDSLGTYPGTNQTLTQYLTDFPVDSRLMQIANALVGNEYGADNDLIGMVALREAESLYSSGSTNFKFKSGTYWKLFEDAFPAVFNKVILNEQIISIDYSGSTVMASSAAGGSYTADKVLVTVPLSILKGGDINFTPALPALKISSIEDIEMGNVLKVILKFNSRFWAEDTSSIIGAERVPEYWVTHAGKESSDFLLTAFVAGTKAESLLQLEESQLISALINELSSLYPIGAVSGRFTGQYVIKDWSQEPFIRGAYSYPSINSLGKRTSLSDPVSDRLYFAGEACNYNGHIGTVHGAMESSYITIAQILKS
ncbi:MAG: NAD(P)/FAD-dependent oxidoreductase [Bacteroidia bacterium]